MGEPIKPTDSNAEAMLKLLVTACGIRPSPPVIEQLQPLANTVCEQSGYEGCYNLMSRFLDYSCRIKIPLSIFRNARDDDTETMAFLWFNTGQKIVKDDVPEGSLDSQSFKVDKRFYYAAIIHPRDNPNLAAKERAVRAALGDLVMATEYGEFVQTILINDSLLEGLKKVVSPALFEIALKSYYIHEYIHTIDTTPQNIYEAEEKFPYLFRRHEIKAFAWQVLYLKENGVSDKDIKMLLSTGGMNGIKTPLETEFAINLLIDDFVDIISGEEGIKRFQRKEMEFATLVLEIKTWFFSDPEDIRLLSALKTIL